VTGDKPIAIKSQSISGVNAINPLVAFYDIHGESETRYSFILSRTPHKTQQRQIQYYNQSYIRLQSNKVAKMPRGNVAPVAIEPVSFTGATNTVKLYKASCRSAFGNAPICYCTKM
jgi:hypothetical protein